MAKRKRVAKTEMNDKEIKTLKAFPMDEPISLSELAKKAFPSMGAKSTTKGNSWVRNSLRFLIRTKVVKQIARGLYQKCQTRDREEGIEAAPWDDEEADQGEEFGAEDPDFKRDARRNGDFEERR